MRIGAGSPVEHYRMVKQQILFWKRDLANVIAHGRGAPRHSQLIYVDPSACRLLIGHDDSLRLGLLRSGVVRTDRFWEEAAFPIGDCVKSQSILSHWVDGVPWEETRVYQRTLEVVGKRPGYEGCFTPQDVEQRYRALDALFEEAERTGRFQTRREFDPANPREMGAIMMHIGDNGEPIFGGEGFHRFCAGLALGIPIPAVVGAVYEGSLDAYRQMTVPPRLPEASVRPKGGRGRQRGLGTLRPAVRGTPGTGPDLQEVAAG